MQPDGLNRLDYFTDTMIVPGEDGAPDKTHQLAGGGARFLAALADLFLQVIAFAVLAWVAIRYRPEMFPPRSWPWAGPVAFIEWHIIYLMLFESFTRGTTPGKALVGLRVVSSSGRVPRPTAMVIRNIARVADLAFFSYLGSLAMISSSRKRQRLGDLLADTQVIYTSPLADQMQSAHVPESLYSTSEDGYLLQAWITRENRFDEESRLASATDLAAYLHSRYDDAAEKSADPVKYLHELYEAETRANE